MIRVRKALEKDRISRRTHKSLLVSFSKKLNKQKCDDMPEFLDVVDKNNHVIGKEERSIVHKKKLFHRSVCVFILNKENKLLVQTRSSIKDEYPLLKGFSMGGHLDSGETYEEAFDREIKEELGIKIDRKNIKKLFTIKPCKENNFEFEKIYLLKYDGKIKADPKEISKIEFVDINNLKNEIKEHPERFCPDFLIAFKRYFMKK